MKPATPKTERPPSTQLRKAFFGGSLHKQTFARWLLTGLAWGYMASQIGFAQTNVTVWGNNAYGQKNVPAALTDAIAISAGGEHIMALKPNGTVPVAGGPVRVWGSNSSGQTIVPPELMSPSPSQKKVVAIAAGYNHCLALKADGTVVAWGAGTTDTGTHPNTGQSIVPTGLSNVVAIAGGGGHGGHSLALKADGTVVGWGRYLGSSGFVPVVVPVGLTNVVSIACGDTHSLALKADGTVVAWGYGPTNVPAGLSNVVSISAGEGHNLVLKGDGTVFAWGNNYYQTNVPANLTNVLAIAAGRWHCLALKADGTVSAWGQYHDGTYYQTMTVPAGLTNVTAIEAGEWTSVALLNGPPAATVPADNLSLIGTTLSLSMSSQCGRVYRLEYLDSLVNANWTAMPLNAGNSSNIALIDFSATNSQRFYRVRRW